MSVPIVNFRIVIARGCTDGQHIHEQMCLEILTFEVLMFYCKSADRIYLFREQTEVLEREICVISSSHVPDEHSIHS